MNDIIRIFFTTLNKVEIVETTDYTNFDNIINKAKAVYTSTNNGIYLLDYYKHNIPYVSENILSWCNYPAEKKKSKDYDHILSYIPKEDLKLLIQINNAVFKFFNKNLSETNSNFSLSYDFHFNGFMVNQHYTPILMKNNKIWIAMCIVTPSTQKISGNIIMNTKIHKYKYYLKEKVWKSFFSIELSPKEKDIIRMSMQGYTNKEIANKTFTTENTIKNQKKNLFKKLQVVNIGEAIQYCTNNGLL
ncbi:MAG: helix-turn-helix transcriptional regulator [Bacteroidales bacterium]|nr:helix-turn-helix transcriptional regulator [Bacteroidales bacterium]